MKIKNYRPVEKGFLKGFATVILDKWGVEISDVSVFDKNGTKWISFPSKAVEKEGKKNYFPYIKFLNPENIKRFQAEFFSELEKWIAENPILAPQESKAQLQEEIPF